MSSEGPKADGLRRRDGEPIFAEPWQAQAMALAATLVEEKRFSAAQWSQVLAEEIQQARAAGEPDSADSYYLCALCALERLTKSQGLLDTDELAKTKQAWIEVHENTPHGQPVSLARAKSS